MITIMSPAKTFREQKFGTEIQPTPLLFQEKTETLLKKLKAQTADELGLLMKMSDTLAKQNYDRYQNFDDLETMTALYAFDGEAFKGLDAITLSETAVEFSKQHFIMLCGLYGILEPMMEMRPYRLEMATKLAVDQAKDLVQYWKTDLTQYLIHALQASSGDQVLLNLASNEYSKALNLKQIQKQFRVVTLEFKDYKNGVYKVVGMYAKKARGQMMRHILENEIDQVESIKEIVLDGYAYNEALSKEDVWVFTR